ncbi:hypothetical protein F4604DRAFT_2034527 [Suillus subluteus]|nr:hypothetical protein F4604DRAFT_2034527 [Suillus subluteus]
MLTVVRPWPGPLHSVEISQRKKHTFNNLDPSTCASLKLTVLNPTGRVWTMVAGDGESVVYSHAIAATGFAHEISNYGEYSGAPSEGQRVEYTKTIHPPGIANFTNVVPTFKGIIHAFTSYKPQLSAHNAKIYVHHGGPNWQAGLKAIRLLDEPLGIPIRVFSPDTHITENRAPRPRPQIHNKLDSTHKHPRCRTRHPQDLTRSSRAQKCQNHPRRHNVVGLQPRAIQGMSDFDYSCKHAPLHGSYYLPLCWTPHPEILLWHTRDSSSCIRLSKKPSRSTPTSMSSSTSRPAELCIAARWSVFGYESIKAIALIVVGVPEFQAGEILWKAKEKGVLIIPATVGGIKPDCFRIENSGGMMDNIIASKLYRLGRVDYTSKSGGMNSNNQPHYERHLRRCKMLVLLDEVGDVEEYRVIEAVKSGKIKKPIIAWAIGTCASMFTTEVQFGHAGSMAHSDSGTAAAAAKNRAMHEVGFIVPATFEEVPATLKSTYEALVAQGVIIPTKEVELPAASMFSGARDMGLTLREFVDNSEGNKFISGIGHKIKTVNNPDLRVELVKECVRKNFPSHSLLDYALAFEKYHKQE